MKIDVLIPALARPARVLPLVASLRASTSDVDAEVRELFLCTPGDDAEIAEVDRHGFRKLVMPFLRGPGDFARKTNMGAHYTDGDWIFIGADDLHFRPGWLGHCLRRHETTGALVIGTNDLGNPTVRRGLHATHLLVHRSYVAQGTIDDTTQLLCEFYDHNCVDLEFVETAMHRHTWAFCAEAEVEHLHWLWRKSKQDATYDLGQEHHHDDLRLLQTRRHLWNHRELASQQRGERMQIVRAGAGRRRIGLR